MAKERVFLGLHSGWAADGVDAAMIAVAGRGERMKVRLLESLHEPMGADLRRGLHAAGGEGAPPARLAALGAEVASAFAGAAGKLIEQSGRALAEIAAIGSSGQMIARGERSAVTLGDATAVARATGLPVAAGFASSDLAAGGCGLTQAWPDWLLLRDERLSRVVVHLGGLASVAFLPAAATCGDVVAFDAGPAGLLLDALAASVLSQPVDCDGAAAARGRVSPAMLNELLSAAYFQAAPPKYTSADEWGEAYLRRLVMTAGRHGCGGADLIATVTELVARAVAGAVARLTERPHEVILTGGGSRNIHLDGRIRAMLSPSSTYAVERYGLGLQSHSAVCQAVLAACRVDEHSAQCSRRLSGGAASASAGEPPRAVLGGLWLP